MPLTQRQEDEAVTIAVKIAEMVDENCWDAIYIATPELGGRISGVNLWDHTIKDSWGYWDFPVSIPLGHEVYAACCGRNKGTGNQIMTLTMQLLDPDGVIRSQSVYTTPTAIVPDDYFCDSTSDDKCVLDKAGTWVLYIKLEAWLA